RTRRVVRKNMNLNRVQLKQNHNIKIKPEYIKEVAKGKKTIEIRKNDRNYQVGDKIILMEFDGQTYTGNEIVAEITYITDYEQKKGYVVFAFVKFSIANRRDAGKT